MEHPQEKAPSFSQKEKMAELVNYKPVILTVLDRFGIQLGFGEDTVESCCRKQDMDPFTFLTVCRIYSFPDFTPSPEDLESLRISDIVRFLKKSHDSYTKTWIPVISGSIDRLMSGRPEAQKKVISGFLDKFKTELESHFKFEDTRLFPSLEAVVSGKPVRGASKAFKQEHGNIEEKIQDLINILMKYVRYENGSDDASWTLMHLYSLKNDISRHSFLEDKILLPVMNVRISK